MNDESIKQPCDFLKRNYYDLGHCPNYGSSNCPITMHENNKCYLSEDYLIEIFQHSGLKQFF